MKAKTRALASALALLMVSGVCTGFIAKPKTAQTKSSVSITFLNSKSEIAKQIEAAAKTYSRTNKDGITVSVSTVSTSSTVDETMMTKYAAGNPCTMNMVDPIGIKSYASKSMALSGQTWAKQINSALVSNLKSGGKLYAFPFAVEGDGLIYNQTTIEKATGKKFDPSKIKSLSDLEALYKKIKKGGVTPVEISHDDWSLASHFLATSFVTQTGGDAAYMKKLKSGAAHLSTNKTYNGLLQLLNLNMKYNIYKSSPMSSDYSTSDPKNIATGKVAFWFNGVWVMPNVSQFLTGSHKNDKLGFLPLFADSKTSKDIGVQVTKVVLVDKVKSTAAQRAAANKFFNWFVSNGTGQKYLVKTMGLIPAFKNVALTPNNGLAKSIVSYLKAGKTIPFANTSGDYYSKVGAYIQQYLVGKMNKSTLSSSIESYFKNASWVS